METKRTPAALEADLLTLLAAAKAADTDGWGGGIFTPETAAELGEPLARVRRALKKMEGRGQVLRLGTKAWAMWRLI